MQRTAYELRISDWSSDVCSSDLLAMAQDLNRAAPRLVGDRQLFQDTVETQASLRSLSEATVFDSSGRIIVRYNNLGFSLFDEPVPLTAIQRAELGEPVLLTSEEDDRLRALVKQIGRASWRERGCQDV